MQLLCAGVLTSTLREAAETQRPVSLLWCDVPDISDLAGLRSADSSREALGEYHHRFTEAVRRADHAITSDGTLFLLVAYNLGDEQDAAGVAYRLLAETVEPVAADNAELNLTWAIGITVGDSTTNPEAMLKHAEAAYKEAAAWGGFSISDLRSHQEDHNE
jgi:GGDEF domain-containing protein